MLPVHRRDEVGVAGPWQVTFTVSGPNGLNYSLVLFRECVWLFHQVIKIKKSENRINVFLEYN